MTITQKFMKLKRKYLIVVNMLLHPNLAGKNVADFVKKIN